jgi:hypothetical protein
VVWQTGQDPHRTLLLKSWGISQITASSDRFRTHFDNDKWKKWREPFQLLVAGLIHSWSALKHQARLTGEASQRFHENVLLIPKVWVTNLFQEKEPPYFKYDSDLGEVFRNMHVASVSFRLPTAVELVHKNILRGTSPFTGFISRLSLEKKYLPQTKGWGCCRTKLFDDIASDEALRICLVMILLHRDHFGHGQKGYGRQTWNQTRDKYFKTFSRCRVAEAQLRLIQWGLNELAQHQPS